MIQDIANKLDLANHHSNATPEDVIKLCANVLTYGFNAAFVNPTYVALAKEKLGGKAKVGTAFSFPLGQDTVEMKVFATQQSIKLGADELDIVPNNALLLFDVTTYSQELKTIVYAARSVNADIVVKFILETGYLTDSQIKTGASAIVDAGADFVKICSGMGRRGASLNDVKLVRESIGDRAKIKVAGGIDTLEEAQGFLAAGADRIGTSSAVKIIEEMHQATSQSF